MGRKEKETRIIGWWSFLAECRICTYRCAVVAPAYEGEPKPEDLECDRCGAMALDPIEEVD